MSDKAFYRLAPFIQQYIWRHKWERLRDIQVEAIYALLDTPDHILIASGTASGKTEAALLPVITDLLNDPPASIGAMYIGPLKALINDQFERLSHLLEHSGLPVQSWHGDVSASHKARFLKRARGILQITPESLEAMLINRHHMLGQLFGDLRFVIIDEVHALIASDRGRQVICQLERLARHQARPARRIGLSATIGEPRLTMEWLRGHDQARARLIQSRRSAKAEIGLEYFLCAKEDDEAAATTGGASHPKEKRKQEGPADKRTLKQLIVGKADYYAHVNRMTRRAGARKTLIFANSRADTEEIIVNLRSLARRQKQPSFYHVHHGSISAPLREAAESAMKAEGKLACTAATVTLELGIDLGQLDQVLQVNSTHSVSSFVQRLGRTGRRGGPARLFFYSREGEREAKHFGEELPWNLLQTLAIIQLYAEEKWIEPPEIPRMPLSLLYHQTMSIVKAHSELSPPQLAARVLELSPFEQITREHFRDLLRHLVEIGHLERTENGKLIIGLEGEKVVNDYRFYAVFADNSEYRVRDKSREVGTLSSAPPVESTLLLAGYAWRVDRVYEDQKIIEVTQVHGQPITWFQGDGAFPIHKRIARKVRQILLSEDVYAYTHRRAKTRLNIARDAARSSGLAESSILPLAPNQFLVFPWSGSRQVSTLLRLLEGTALKLKDGWSPYWYTFEADAENVAELRQELRAICASPPDAAELTNDLPQLHLRREKYDCFVPPSLLREAFARDAIDIPGAIESMEQL